MNRYDESLGFSQKDPNSILFQKSWLCGPDCVRQIKHPTPPTIFCGLPIYIYYSYTKTETLGYYSRIVEWRKCPPKSSSQCYFSHFCIAKWRFCLSSPPVDYRWDSCSTSSLFVFLISISLLSCHSYLQAASFSISHSLFSFL